MSRLLVRAEPVEGYFILDGYGRAKNVFTRNMGNLLHGLIALTDVTLYTTDGTTRTFPASQGTLCPSFGGYSGATYYHGPHIYIQFGFSTTAPSPTDNDLRTPSDRLPSHYWDILEGDTQTQLVHAGRWSPDGDRLYFGEVGLKMHAMYYSSPQNVEHLLSRAVISPLPRYAYTEYFDGHVVNFPKEYTRWFVRALFVSMSSTAFQVRRGLVARDVNNSVFVLRCPNPFAGSPDVMIGGDNTPASPTDYNLYSPIASLSSQTQTVEVDTVLNEVRVVRSGTYTPATSVTVGEIGLFCNMAGFVGGSSVTRRTLLCRVAFTTPVTLEAGKTYTFGIVLVLK